MDMKQELGMKAVEILKKLGLPEEVVKQVADAVSKSDSVSVEVEAKSDSESKEDSDSESVCEKCGAPCGKDGKYAKEEGKPEEKKKSLNSEFAGIKVL